MFHGIYCVDFFSLSFPIYGEERHLILKAEGGGVCRERMFVHVQSVFAIGKPFFFHSNF